MFKQARITERSFDYLLLIIITLLTFWPATFHVFSFKNDALVQYLPFRYHVSESIQNGHFPFWSPFLYTGFPIHADMQGMTWNPIVLVISFITRYNMSVLQTEMIIYLVVAAIGMYRLLDVLGCNRPSRVVGAISFVACGYITDSASVMPWVASAAFLPFVFSSFIVLTRRVDFINAIGFATSLSFLFLCGYPSFFILAAYVLIAAVVTLYFHKSSRNKYLNKAWWKFLIISAVLFLFICSPAIYSYIDFLPYYSRGSGLSIERAATNPFPLPGIISFFTPQAPSRSHELINTDLSVRNGYVGLLLFIFFILTLLSKKTILQKFILAGIAFFFIYSIGNITPVHEWSYRILPFFKTFRHPGTVRVFTSLGIIVLGCIALHRFIETGWKWKQVRVISISIACALLVIGLICAIGIKSFPATTGIKPILDSITFNHFGFGESILQLCFVVAFIFLLKKNRTWSMKHLVLFALNVILFAQFALPLTFFSQLKTAQVDKYVDSFPDGYPVPDMNQTIRTGYYADSTTVHPEGYSLFYDKTIRYHDHLITPTVNSDYDSFSNRRDLRNVFDQQRIAYFATKLLPDTLITDKDYAAYQLDQRAFMDSFSTGTVEIKSISPNRMVLHVLQDLEGLLVVFQQWNHNWRAYVNKDQRPVYSLNLAFIGLPVYKGETVVELIYDPVEVKWCMWISAITILSVIVMLVLYTLRKSE